MNEQIIPILDRKVGDSINAVDARDLHSFLDVGRDFTNWIKDRIGAYGFIQGRDFEVFAESGENAGRPRSVYVVSIDMAKELAMVERNDKGKQARAYFIEMERRARDPMHVLADPARLRHLLGSYAERVMELEANVAKARPKVEVYDRIVEAPDTFGFREACKVLRKSTGVTERELASTLVSRGWAQRLNKRLQPAHFGEERGYVTSRMCEWRDAAGEYHTKPEFRLTPKGIAKLTTILAPEDVA